MTEMVRLFVGYDPREAAAYHVFCDSVIEHASIPVSFTPVTGATDGSNAFTLARYLVPSLCDFRGWALFADGDMVMTKDIAELWAMRPLHTAVSVVKHDYTTRHPRKYLGSRMESPNYDYPRKNWSSLVFWHCSHFANGILTPEYVAEREPSHLHRFGWLRDDQIGDLPPEWNYLVGEAPMSGASNYHYTLGVPGIKHYADSFASWRWHRQLVRALQCAGESPEAIAARAEERIGAVQ